MWCSVCHEFYDLADLMKEQNLWLTGTTNYKIDTIKSHESSKIHMKAAKVEAVKATGVRQTVVQLKMKQHSMIQNQFRNAHAVVKHDLSFRTYSMLCELDAAKGYKMSADYMSDNACRTFVHVVADVEVREPSNQRWGLLLGSQGGPWFNIYLEKKNHLTSFGDPIVVIGRIVRSSYLHNGISYTAKMMFLYWITTNICVTSKIW